MCVGGWGCAAGGCISVFQFCVSLWLSVCVWGWGWGGVACVCAWPDDYWDQRSVVLNWACPAAINSEWLWKVQVRCNGALSRIHTHSHTHSLWVTFSPPLYTTLQSHESHCKEGSWGKAERDVVKENWCLLRNPFSVDSMQQAANLLSNCTCWSKITFTKDFSTCLLC